MRLQRNRWNAGRWLKNTCIFWDRFHVTSLMGAFRERCGAVKFALQSINEVTVREHFSRGGESPWYSEDPFHKPVKVVREIYAGGVIRFNAPISDYLEERTLERFPSVAE
ncbi:putative retrotransposon hot spot (RHS) protein [Trypanosoma cruzi]|nr:putative retrotransposon hot spot (RHS) protein [Trypanosoma cruzi]